MNDISVTSAAALNNNPGSLTSWEFQHPDFQQSRPELLHRIKRKSSKSEPSVSGNPARPEEATESIDATDSRPVIDVAPVAVRKPILPPRSTSSSTGFSELGAGQRNSTGLPDYSPRTSLEGARVRDSARASPVISSDYVVLNREPLTYSTSSNSQYLPRQAPPQQVPAPPQQMVSPRSATYPSLGPNAPAQYASNSLPRNAVEGQMVRQITGLDHQMKGLSAAFYRAQQDAVTGRSSTFAVLKILLDLVESLDKKGEHSHASQYSRFTKTN